MFEDYVSKHLPVNGVNIQFRIGGSGPGLLLLHGHPQSHMVWPKVADALATRFTVVAADLRGYGDSEKPGRSNFSEAYSKRTVAQDQYD